MKHFFIILVIAMGFFSFLRCTAQGNSRPVDPKEADGLLKNRLAVLVDVREEKELKAEGMAVGAEWIPTSKIQANTPEWQAFKSKLDKDKMVIFYCAAGVRAGKAADLLAKEGFKTGNMGGFQDWVKEKLPVQECKACK